MRFVIQPLVNESIAHPVKHLVSGLCLCLASLCLTVPARAVEPEEPPEVPLPEEAPTPLEESLEVPQPAENVIEPGKMEALMEQNLGPEDDAQPDINLLPQDAIDIALQRNLGLAIVRYRPSISADGVIVAESEYDPVLSSAANASGRLSPQAASNLDGVAAGQQPQTTSQSGEFGIAQKLPTGGTLRASTGINRSTTNSNRTFLNPDYTSDARLDVRQPLLKNFGATVNLADIAKARLSLRQSRLEVRKEVLDVIAEAEIRYWSLAAARARKLLYDTNLTLSESLLDENKARERVGLATRLEVLQAEASLAARSEDVILAQQQVENSEDRLRTFLGDLDYDPQDALNVAPLPEINPPVPNFRDSVRSALAQDMDTQIQYEIIEKRRIDKQVAQNQTLPSLDLTAGVGLLGRDGEPTQSYENTYTGSGYAWNTGLELSFPWGMRAARAELNSTRLDIRREETRLAEIQQILLLNLREAWRAVVAGKERTATTRASLVLNEESFVRERARYDAGASTFRNVLEAQRDFDEAKIRHLDAMVDLIRATIRLSRLDGTILERHGFTWEEVDETTQRLPDQVEPLAVETLQNPSALPNPENG